MGDFFFQYGLFTAKTLTVFVSIALVLLGFVSILSLRVREDKETLEIKNINEKFEDLKDSLEAEILPKEEYKQLQKQRKKKEKLEKKEEKKKAKSKHKTAKPQENTESEDTIEHQKNMYVLRFTGDMHANEVENLREEITAILSIAKPEDQVLVILESAGGTVHNYGLGASQLKRITDKNIKLTAAVDLVAASGGYMMACVADEIIAANFAIVGSIGVLAQLPNFNKILKKHDIEIEHHTAGEYKTTLTMLGKNTKEGREKFQEELEETHKLFKQHVKSNREILDIDKIATGEYWYGQQALDLKLIDKIQTSDDFLMEKSQDWSIYEITYQFHESLKEKLSAMVYKSGVKLFSKIWQKLNYCK